MGLDYGAKMPGREVMGELPLKAVYEIAKAKQVDMPDIELESIAKMVSSTAKSMGILTEKKRVAKVATESSDSESAAAAAGEV